MHISGLTEQTDFWMRNLNIKVLVVFSHDLIDIWFNNAVIRVKHCTSEWMISIQLQ